MCAKQKGSGPPANFPVFIANLSNQFETFPAGALTTNAMKTLCHSAAPFGAH
jgi:hypothetical protein